MEITNGVIMSERQWLFMLILAVGFVGLVVSGAHAPLTDLLFPDMGDDFDSDGSIRVDNGMSESVTVTLMVLDPRNETRVWTENLTVYHDTDGNDSAVVEWPRLRPGNYRFVVVANGNWSDPYEFSLREDGSGPKLIVWIRSDGDVDVEEVATG